MINYRRLISLSKPSKLTYEARKYLTLTGFTGLYAYFCYKSRNAESEIFKVGVAGSLAVFAVEMSHFPMDLINNRNTLKGINKGSIKSLMTAANAEGVSKLFSG